VCASLNGGAVQCYHVPSSSRDELTSKAAASGIKTPYYTTAAACVRSGCNDSASHWQIQTGGAPSATPSGGGGGAGSSANLDCFSPEAKTFVCAERAGRSEIRSGPADGSANSLGTDAEEAVMRRPLSRKHGKEEGRGAAHGSGGAEDQGRLEASEVNARAAQLVQQQRAALLGQEAAGAVASTGHDVAVLAVRAAAWGTPFGGSVRLLGDGSALIAAEPSGGEKLVSLRQIGAAENLAHAVHNAPVAGALAWLEQGSPLGYVNTQQPRTAWPVGGGPSSRFPQHAPARPSPPPTTLDDALFALQNSASAKQGSGETAHFCCKSSEEGCQLQTAPPGTEGCHPVLGAAMLSAAEARCNLSCAGRPSPGAAGASRAATASAPGARN
jgi:hypothetical protein